MYNILKMQFKYKNRKYFYFNVKIQIPSYELLFYTFEYLELLHSTFVRDCIQMTETSPPFYDGGGGCRQSDNITKHLCMGQSV